MAIVAVAVDLRIHAAAEPGARPPGIQAYAFGLLMAALLPARRRRPLAVLFASGGLLFVYHVLGNPGMSPALPLAVPLYAVAVAGHLWWAVGAAVTAASMALVFTVVQDHVPMSVALSQRVPEAALLAALILLGDAIRSRRALARQMRRAARHAALERERESERRVTEERLCIARELHDVLAHTLAGAAIQAGVATDTLTDDPNTSRAAMEEVRASYREARAELAATLGVLRADPVAARASHRHPPVPGLAHLDAPLSMARDAGLKVDVLLDGRPRPLQPPVDITAYRIVQESLTNVVRHASARSVVISLGYGPAEVTISIIDDGKGDEPRNGGHPATSDGYGLIGMRERTAAIGGHIAIGPRTQGGFQVVATLPAVDELGVAR
jgi:MYXO-CTERM domain-containing protein